MVFSVRACSVHTPFWQAVYYKECNSVSSNRIELVTDSALLPESCLVQTTGQIGGRRQVLCNGLLALNAIIFGGFLQNAEAEEGRTLELVPYTDEKNGFTFLRPDPWSKVEKDGATVLFEDPAKKSNNVGVVVNPVRISSLAEFGSPEDVANKLIQAERKKVTTNSAELVEVQARRIHETIPLYQIEYKLDSSRGVKRIYSGVTIASKKLYVINLAFADELNNPISPATAASLKAIVESFNLVG